MSDVRIERIEGPRMQEWQDVAYGVALGTSRQRELRQLAATFAADQILSPEKHLAIETAVSQAQNKIIGDPVEIEGTPARLVTRPDMVVEVYGRALPDQAQFAYPKDPRHRITNPLTERYPGAVGIVNYFRNL